MKRRAWNGRRICWGSGILLVIVSLSLKIAPETIVGWRNRLEAPSALARFFLPFVYVPLCPLPAPLRVVQRLPQPTPTDLRFAQSSSFANLVSVKRTQSFYSSIFTVAHMNTLTKFTAVALTIVSIVQAYCPNGCSGAGTCGPYDSCECYKRADVATDPAFTGADCSLKTCPKGKAWVATLTSKNGDRPDTECSSRGLCNREGGACECFPGYEGKACERTSCPNACSGRGVCKSQKQLAVDASMTYSAPWDAEKSMGCVCDKGFRGPDCSLRECPSGADVLAGYGKAEGRDCGGRGKCNYETGVCECFSGYYGTACNMQTTFF